MKARRILLGRREAQTATKKDCVQVRFDDVPMDALFTLYSHEYTNVYFVKTHTCGAQVLDSSNDSGYMDQRFPPDALVWVRSNVKLS